MKIEISLNFSSYMRLAFSAAIGLGVVNAIIAAASFSAAPDQAANLSANPAMLIQIYIMGAGTGFLSGIALALMGGFVAFPIYSALSKKGFFSIIEGTPLDRAE